MAKGKITRERAELVAKAHACESCGEYSYKRVSVKPAPATQRKELAIEWIASKLCGICGAEQEIGINAEGHVVY